MFVGEVACLRVYLGVHLCIYAREFTQLSVQPYLPLAMKDTVISVVQLDCWAKATRRDFLSVKPIMIDLGAKFKQTAC